MITPTISFLVRATAEHSALRNELDKADRRDKAKIKTLEALSEDWQHQGASRFSPQPAPRSRLPRSPHPQAAPLVMAGLGVIPDDSLLDMDSTTLAMLQAQRSGKVFAMRSQEVR